MNEEQKDILKYYKVIKICSNSSCNRPYGTDMPFDNGICPICLNKLMDRHSKLDKGNLIVRESTEGEYE